MSLLTPGGNATLPSPRLSLLITHPTLPGADIDTSAFLVAANGRVRSDVDMCFYGQPEVANGAVALAEAQPGRARFALDLKRLPTDVEKIVLTATIHENAATFGALTAVELDAGGVRVQIPCAGMTETALLLAEIYRRNGAWKIRAIGQGFTGGLVALATHFGVDIGESDPVSAPAAPEAKLVRLEKQAPEMVSLVKQATVSLAKNKAPGARAKMALVLDISGSMRTLYKSGKVDVLVKRVMAMGYALDDDGDIDVFLFGQRVHAFGTVDVGTYAQTVPTIMRDHPLENGTRYGDAIAAVRAHYARDNPTGLPVFVLFVTDGGTDDKPKTERELRAASHEPLFWKFMAIQEGTGRWDTQRFEFLTKLDDLTGRAVDNADAFSLSDPAAPSDAEMFDMMMEEYADWLAAARAAGIVRAS